MGARIYRLAEARELRAMTVAELAEKLDITRQAIYKYESGTQMPIPEIMDLISSALKFPLSFFLAPHVGVPIDDRTVFFRDMKTNQEKNRKMAKRWLQLLYDQITKYEQYVELPEVVLLDIGSFDIEDASMEDIDILAEKVRRHWGLGDGPISNVTQLLENHGIVVARRYFEADKLDACSAIIDGRPVILINTFKQTCSRDILNMAHELGHLVMHQSVTSEQLTNQVYFEKIESQAWRFAASFLMPPSVYANEVGYPTLSTFEMLKKRWRTSIASQIVHCRNLGIISDERKIYFFREMSRQKIRSFEPLDDVLPIEQNSLLFDCEKLIVSEEIETKEGLLDESKLSQCDYRELINAPKEYYTPIQRKPVLRIVRN